MSHQSELIETDINAYLAQHERKELLRFLTCGSVDDGKSTLIGRLLHDSKMIYEDQLDAIKKDSIKSGTQGGEIDLALLVDGLQAEREQGITIDVAYRYFSTAKRKFIIADTPGHEQYTRNMATGASTCDLAVILIDARHGVLTQTRRHSFIASLLGIKHIIVAINKMDIVGYSEERFEEIKNAYSDFASRLDMPDIQFVPMSALKGDNVVNPSENMPWYTGSTLMYLLENVHIASDRNLIDFRFPVQYVNRPNLDFRGFCGTIASGIVRPGDEIMVLPSRKKSKVKSIVTWEGEVSEAFAPMAPTLTLEDEIDVSRGDMIVHVNNTPKVAQNFEAMIVWMAEEPMKTGKQYTIKHTTTQSPAVISQVRYRMDINSVHRIEAAALELNEIGRCVVELARPVAFDAYTKNRSTGGFIIIDRLTNNTVAAGMILDRDSQDVVDQRREKMRAGGRVHDSLITPEERIKRLDQKPITIWFTAPTGSGKSNIAYALERRLFDFGKTCHVLDGGNARLGLSADLDFTTPDRAENLRRAAQVARLFNEVGLISICAFLSPSAADRQQVRQIIGDERFMEIYVDSNGEDRAKRIAADEKSKEDLRRISPFFDINAEYEIPQQPDLVINTSTQEIDECVTTIMNQLQQRGVF